MSYFIPLTKQFCQQDSGDSHSGSDEAPKQRLGGLWLGRGKKKKKSKEKVEKEGASDKCAESPTCTYAHLHTSWRAFHAVNQWRNLKRLAGLLAG